MSVDPSRKLLEHSGARPPTREEPTVDELVPAVVFEPESVTACGQTLALCHQEGLAVLPIGGGTRVGLGNTPSRLDAYVSTKSLTGVRDHIAGDLTVFVAAGTTLSSLQRELEPAGQFLPLEVPLADRATIGGILAVGEPGFRRRPGARPRDLLLGCEAVLADGRVVKVGGRVVKNVAGYEITKLLVGSAGTLAVLTGAFLRLRALPERRVTIQVEVGSADRAAEAWKRLRERGLEPEAAAVVNPTFAEKWLHRDWVLNLHYEGLEEETSAMSRAAAEELTSTARSAKVETIDGPDAHTIWNTIHDFPLKGRGALGLRGEIAPKHTFALARELADGGALAACPDGGIVYSDTEDAEALTDLLDRAERLGARLVVERAPVSVKQNIDIYGESPSGLDLMQGIKRALDTKGILSPGRFVGRI